MLSTILPKAAGGVGLAQAVFVSSDGQLEHMRSVAFSEAITGRNPVRRTSFSKDGRFEHPSDAPQLSRSVVRKQRPGLERHGVTQGSLVVPNVSETGQFPERTSVSFSSRSKHTTDIARSAEVSASGYVRIVEHRKSSTSSHVLRKVSLLAEGVAHAVPTFARHRRLDMSGGVLTYLFALVLVLFIICCVLALLYAQQTQQAQQAWLNTFRCIASDILRLMDRPNAANEDTRLATVTVDERTAPAAVSAKSKVAATRPVCTCGTQCKTRGVHLRQKAHPFDVDYLAACQQQGVMPEEPSLRGLFNWIDTDSSGKISYEELQAALPMLSNLSGEKIVVSSESWQRIDDDNNGCVNFSEFAAWAGPRFGLTLGVAHLFKGPSFEESHGCAVLNCPCEAFATKNSRSWGSKLKDAAASGDASAAKDSKSWGAKFKGVATKAWYGTRARDKGFMTCRCGHKFASHAMTIPSEWKCEVPYPPYWDGPTKSQEFNDRIVMQDRYVELFQRLLDQTYESHYTKDRAKHNPLNARVPKRFRVVQVLRSENSQAWREYAVKRAELIQRRTKPDGEDDSFPLEEYRDVKSASVWMQQGGALADRLKPECNEWYLFHGTTAEAAESISKTDFKFSRAGSNTGTMYGRGVYMAESITKADEYAKPNLKGEYTALLVRAIGGLVRYTDEPSPDDKLKEDLLESCLSGPYDCVLGDRRKCRGTYREFVFFDTENFYAEYIIRYTREY